MLNLEFKTVFSLYSEKLLSAKTFRGKLNENHCYRAFLFGRFLSGLR